MRRFECSERVCVNVVIVVAVKVSVSTMGMYFKLRESGTNCSSFTPFCILGERLQSGLVLNCQQRGQSVSVHDLLWEQQRLLTQHHFVSKAHYSEDKYQW